LIYAGLLAFSVYQALPSQAETVFLKFRNAAYVLTVA